jgi:hypothetical protein
MNWSDPTDPPHRYRSHTSPTLHNPTDYPSIPDFFAALVSFILLILTIYLLAWILPLQMVCFIMALAHMAAVLGGIWLFYRHKSYWLGLIAGGLIAAPLIYIILLILVYLFSDATW